MRPSGWTLRMDSEASPNCPYDQTLNVVYSSWQLLSPAIVADSLFPRPIKVPIMTFKAPQDLGCICLKDRLLPYVLMCQLWPSNCLVLADPPLQIARVASTRAHTFCTVVHAEWHRLPGQVRVAPLLGIFKRCCKTYFIFQGF